MTRAMATLFTLFCALTVWAQPLQAPCELLNKRSTLIQGLRKHYPKNKIGTFLAHLKEECKIQKLFERNQLQASNYQLELEQISAYQALRYIKEKDYLSGAKYGIPVPLIYQLFYRNYETYENRTSEVWDNWSTGISQLPKYVQKLRSGEDLTIEDLQTIHVGFYQDSLEEGDFSHNPERGEFVMPEPYHDGWPWWEIALKEVKATQNKINRINIEMRRMRLLPPIDEVDPRGMPYSSLLFLYKTKKEGETKSKWYIWSSDTRYTRLHYERLMAFIKNYLEVNRSDYSIEPWDRFPLLTPMQMAALVQKWFVGVHGFHEGNGRMSRFLQDMLLELFGLPYAKSGALMDSDVLTTLDEYYQLFRNHTYHIMRITSLCLEREYPPVVETHQTLGPLVNDQLNYRCRLLR